MDNEEMEELFGPLRAAGWNPRWMDRSVVHYDNSVAAGYPTDIRVCGLEQLIRYATILLDISDESKGDFDELLLERNKAGRYWLHFAVRPSGNRRKVRMI